MNNMINTEKKKRFIIQHGHLAYYFNKVHLIHVRSPWTLSDS